MNQSAVSTLEQRASKMVAAMTLAEKASQMVHRAPAIERLGIPAYNWWNEGLHGVGRAGVATVFPQAIGLGATWNPALMDRVARVISDEARAKHHEAARRGIRDHYTGLTFWSPNINIFRDPRWGRGQETYGEDPYLTAALGVAFVRGLQGDHPEYLKLVATPKHYAVHSGPEVDRHRFDAQVSEREMREFYLFAFEAAIRVGKAASIMGAYNRINGVPACASDKLLIEILRDEWGFDGFVVSDCEAIRDIFKNHKVVDTAEAAAAMAVLAGCDLNCGSVFEALIEAVQQGLIDESILDHALTRLFKARFQLGMFDSPNEVPFASIPYDVIASPEHRALALQAARESLVLLKNEGDLLPLSKNIGSIAVIGPNANDLTSQLGNYNGTPSDGSTVLSGIRALVSAETEVIHAQGCEVVEGVPQLEVIPAEYLSSAHDENGHGLSASYFNHTGFEGPPALTRVDPAVNFIWKDTSPLSGEWGEKFSARWEGMLTPPVSGRYYLGINGYSEYRFFFDGELFVQEEHIHHPMRKVAAVELTAGHAYPIQIELVNDGLDPQIQLLWARPDVDYEAEALRAAEQADAVVMVMGLSAYLEGEDLPIYPDVGGFKGGDRTQLDLPGSQEALLKKIHALGKPVVLVLMNGSALAVNWAAENVPAILDAWYPGEAGGLAVAEVLFGDTNPGGKLPVTFYRSVDDLPPFEDYTLEGHTYRYFRGEALYPFGFGLSFTTFAIENLRLDAAALDTGAPLMVSVDVTNTGSRDGDEVIQVYLRRPGDSAAPIKQLIAFQRVSLAAGEQITVRFTIHAGQLGSYDDSLRYVLPSDTVELLVGTSSEALPLAAQVKLPAEIAGSEVEKSFFSDVVID